MDTNYGWSINEIPMLTRIWKEPRVDKPIIQCPSPDKEQTNNHQIPTLQEKLSH